MSIRSLYVDFQSSSIWSIPKGSFCETSSLWNRYPKTAINNFPEESQVTYAAQRSINTASEPFTVISGMGAENFKEEFETMEYPENIKSVYKNSKELVRKLGLFP